MHPTFRHIERTMIGRTGEIAMVRTRGVVAVAAFTALAALGGCAGMRRDKYCKWGIPAWGAVAGGTAAGLGVGLGADDPSDAEIAGSAVGGTLVGGLLGWLVAHNVCEEPEAPPPAPVAAPPPPPPPAKGTKLGTVGEAYFDFDKAHLKPGAEDVLRDAVRTLKDNPSVHAEIAGHTDSIGSDAYNMKLSERRAEAVKRYLVEQGIDASRLDVRGYGESHPIADNKTKQGRAQNRRAEIIVE